MIAISWLQCILLILTVALVVLWVGLMDSVGELRKTRKELKDAIRRTRNMHASEGEQK